MKDRSVIQWIGVQSRRAGRVRRRLLLILALLAVVVALLPTIVAKTPLRDAILSAALPTEQFRVRARGASFGWFRGPELYDVEINDPAGGPALLSVKSLRINRPFLALASNPQDLGTIEITQPILYIAARPDGSNLEDALQAWIASQKEQAPEQQAETSLPRPVAATVRISDGTILIDDLAARHRWRAEKINVELVSSDIRAGVSQLALSGQLLDLGAVDDRQQPAAPSASGSGSLTLTTDGNARQQLAWQVDSLSIAVARPWLQRYLDAIEVSGVASGSGKSSWTPTIGKFPADFLTTGLLRLDRAEAAASVLSGDRLRFDRVEIPWQFSSQAVGLVINDMQLISDVGRIAVRGVVDPQKLAQGHQFGVGSLDAMMTHDLEVRAALDLRRIASMLPHALRIRDDTQITDGTIELIARHEPTQAGQRITGSLRAASIAATSGGSPISWAEPVNADFAIERNNGHVRVESLQCKSEFLTINASGTMQQFSAQASFDLSRLASQLGQFVDLRRTELGGSGTAQLDWRKTGEQFQLATSGQLSQFRAMLDGGKTWTEPQLALRADAVGTTDPVSGRVARIATGRMELSGQGDLLEARLLQPVDMSLPTPGWSIALKANGSIARWSRRLRPWYAWGAWEVDGDSELSANVRVAGQATEIDQATLSIVNLRAVSPEWNIAEPRLEFSGDARWDDATGEFVASSAQLVTSTVSLALKDVTYRPQRAGTSSALSQLNGIGAFRADLARLAAWRSAEHQTPQYKPQGMLEGKLSFTQQADGVRGELTATGQNLSLAQLAANPGAARPAPSTAPGGYKTIWQESQLNVRGLVSYLVSLDRLTFDQFQVKSNTMQAGIRGQIDQLSSAGIINVNGTLDYDLAQVTPLLKPYFGEGIELSGREQARFTLAGQLFDSLHASSQVAASVASDPYRVVNPNVVSTSTHWSRRVHGRLEAPWGGANLYGLPVGAGLLSVDLGAGMIRVAPLALSIGEGRLTAAPIVRLDPPPTELTLPQGPLLTNVRISPQVSEAMLKYFAPVMAGATQSEGQFSMELDGARVPPGDALRIAAQGRLTVHSVRVTPGPLAQPLIGLAQQIEALAKSRDPSALAQRPPMTLLAIRDQTVNFRVLNGRVEHDQLEFMIDDVVLRSQGSVGFDETLALTIHVPIQDRWIANERLLVGLKGQTLAIPIGGTLGRPQIDQRAVANLSQQVLQSAAQQAIGTELNKALEKLFKSK